MRNLLLALAFILLCAAPVRAAEAETYWIYRLEASRPDLMATLTPEEGALLKAHQARLQQLRDRGKLVLAGVCEDFAFGVVVFRAAGLAAAQRLVDGDPVVAGGLLKADLHPFSRPLMP